MSSPNSSETFYDLPAPIWGPCSVSYNSTHILLIGGNSGGFEFRNETYWLNIQNGQWSTGPRLNLGRFDHGCGTTLVNKKPVIFVTGGWNNGRLNSVEFLDVTNPNQGWQKGQMCHFKK